MYKTKKFIKKDIHILLFGPVTNVAENLIGGATISFGYLLRYLVGSGEHFTLVNTQKYVSGPKRLLNPVYILGKTLVNASRADVLFLNSSRGGTKYLAPLLYIIARMVGAKFVFRPFGGDIHEYTADYSKWQKWIFRKMILRADIFFLQTKALLQFYSEQGARIIQLPTSRDQPPAAFVRNDRPFQKRFVYLGFVNQAKGIDHILEASRQLGTDYTFHIYGPVKEARYHDQFRLHEGIYRGVLEKEKVLATLRNYDVLVLPTFYEGEGYPGVLLEAYSLGLPVITTRWKSIPEIVDHRITGLLIEPRSTPALITAVQHFNTANYPEYSGNARAYFLDAFSSEQVTGKAMSAIRALFPTEQNQNLIKVK